MGQKSQSLLFRNIYGFNTKVTALAITLLVISSLHANSQRNQSQNPPNIIIIFADDLGYGDLSCYGHPTIRTPNLDQMAEEGMRFTQFYVGSSVCSPSRAALLTGRLPIRNGMVGKQKIVLFPYSAGGLPQTEITIAKALKTKGYGTAIIGKWHLGHLPEFLPAHHGFDYYYGIPYSNDMLHTRNKNYDPLPLYKDSKVVEENPDQTQLTKQYTNESIAFIKRNRNKPFFLYYANNFPHEPLFASDDFKGKSKRGLYGDVVSELDWSVGQILKTLKEENLDKKTLVIFTSDNGPTVQQLHKNIGGSAGPLYEGKKTTYEGGMRVPAIAWWPGTIPANRISEAIATTMDLYPTILNLAQADLPTDRKLDGVDIYPILTGNRDQGNELVYYYNQDELYALRKGSWKIHFKTKSSESKEEGVIQDPPLLYNLDVDPSERFNETANYPEIIEDLQREYSEHIRSLQPVTYHFDKFINQKQEQN